MLGLVLMSFGVLGNYLNEVKSLGTQGCSSYSCAERSGQKPTADACLWLNTSSSNSFYLWPCASGTFCNSTLGKCIKNPATPSNSNIGGPCSVTTSCLTGTCQQGFCRGLLSNQKCSNHEQCDYGLRCLFSNNTCQPQIPIGQQGCNSYLDCVNWGTCNLTAGSSGTCVAYSSVGLGSLVNDCENGFSYMCKMGSCTRKGLFSTLGLCNFPPVSNSALPMLCRTEDDCLGTSSGQLVTSQCSCGVNPYAQKYCMPFIGDLPGQNMIKVWTQALSMAGKCNTVFRSDASCMASIGMSKNVTRASLLYYNYPAYQGNDDCIKVNVNEDYWGDAIGLALGFGLMAFVI